MSSIIPPFVSYTVPKTEATTGCNLETGCITKHEGPRCSAFRSPGSFPGTGENPNRPVSISCTSSANSRSGIRCRLFLSPKAFNTPVSILACSMFSGCNRHPSHTLQKHLRQPVSRQILIGPPAFRPRCHSCRRDSGVAGPHDVWLFKKYARYIPNLLTNSHQPLPLLNSRLWGAFQQRFSLVRVLHRPRGRLKHAPNFDQDIGIRAGSATNLHEYWLYWQFWNPIIDVESRDPTQISAGPEQRTLGELSSHSWVSCAASRHAQICTPDPKRPNPWILKHRMHSSTASMDTKRNS